MEQGTSVEKGSDDSSQTDENAKARGSEKITYETFLTSAALKKALKGQTATELEKRLVTEFANDNNVIVEYDRDYLAAGANVALALADLAKAGERTLLIASTAADTERLISQMVELPLTVDIKNDESKIEEGGDEKLKMSPSAALIIASFDIAAQLDFAKEQIKKVAFLGFASGARIPGSGDFEQFLEKSAELPIFFCSDSIPLTLNAAINRHIKNDDCVHVNLEKEQEVQLSHEYYEVGHELLAKPEALGTIFGSDTEVRAIIFCNSPSDTDLLEVLLKKQGLKAKKLIGNIPDRAIHSTMDQVHEGKVNILILTDISGGAFPVEEFDLIVHYATPEDPETYLHRLGQPDGSSRLKRVISLVGSMDLGNFHFLKKVVEFDFKPQALPSAEDLAKARFERFAKEVSEFSTEDAELLEYARLIGESEDTSKFTLYLLNQALRKLPEAESQNNKGGRRNRRDRRDERGDDRGNDERRSNRKEREPREERPKPKPTRKDLRFYVGHGLDNGLTEAKFLEIVTEKMGDTAPMLQRSCLRSTYSFFDFARSEADELFETLQDAEYEGKELIFQKAAILSVPLEEEEQEVSSESPEKAEEQSEAVKENKKTETTEEEE